MDKSSRVKNIKQRFENINHSNEHDGIKKNDQLKNLRIFEKDTKIMKPSKCSMSYANNKETISNSRSNIKRRPAFRRDKIPARNNYLNDKTKPSIVSSRVHLFNNMDDIENENGILTKEFNSIKSINNCSKLVTETTTELNHIYSQVNKSNKNPRNKKPASDSVNLNNIENSSSLHDKKSAKTLENNVNKENDLCSVNGCSPNDINDDLSDTLKRVLRSPLPPGPPPKKPPRTFTSKSSTNNIACGQNLKNRETKTSVSTSNSESLMKENSFWPKVPLLVRSKTESEIKLKKIENALINHQKQIFSPKLTIRKSSLEDSSVSTAERYAGINKNKRRSSDKGILNQLSSCLSDLNRTTQSENMKHFSEPLVSSSFTSILKSDNHHIYEDPMNLNSLTILPNKEIEDNSLYYMSTPIDNIISPLEYEDVTEYEDITEAQNLNVKLDYFLNTHFYDEVYTTSQNNNSIDNTIKMWMNEAYGKSWTKVSDASSDSDSVFSSTQDDLTLQNEQEKLSVAQYDQLTLTRKGYCQKVASKATSRKQSILTQTESDCKHLFECLLLIGLNLDAHNEKVPYIKMKYPSHINVPQSIEYMCFPDARDWFNKPSEKVDDTVMDEDRCYVIPLTNEVGIRKYAYCRRIKPEGESFSLPLSYCILSSHKANEFYFTVLEEVENRHGQSEIEFQSFIKELYDNRFPLKGQRIKVSSSSDERKDKVKDELFLMRPSDTRLEDLRLAKTLAYLKINRFLLIFSSLLLERKVILLSSCISKLSTCIEGLQVALLPFEWQHTLITVVPSNLISVSDICDAPTPYLIGLLKPKNNPTRILSYLNNKMQVLVVDLDEKKVLRKVGDENSILPNHLAKGLKNALQLAHSSEIHTNNLLACEAFTRLFVEAVGHYRRYILFSGNDLNHRKLFQKEAFVKAAPSHQIRMFLEWFVETAAFSVFINHHLQTKSQSKGLFEKRCNEYFEELIKSKYGKNNKLNKTVKQIGDLIKDWTNTSTFN